MSSFVKLVAIRLRLRKAGTVDGFILARTVRIDAPSWSATLHFSRVIEFGFTTSILSTGKTGFRSGLQRRHLMKHNSLTMGLLVYFQHRETVKNTYHSRSTLLRKCEKSCTLKGREFKGSGYRKTKTTIGWMPLRWRVQEPGLSVYV